MPNHMTQQEIFDQAPDRLKILVTMIRGLRLRPIVGPPVEMIVEFHSTTIISVGISFLDYASEMLLGEPEWASGPPSKVVREILDTLRDRFYEKYPASNTDECQQWESICGTLF